MTHPNSGHFAAKHSDKTRCDQEIAEAVKRKVEKRKITCAAAHQIAQKLHKKPAEVGIVIDLLEIKISRCQLGLFGYYPKKKIVEQGDPVPQELKEKIKNSVVNHKIGCLACWKIADSMDISKLSVAQACETLAIMISDCQLGAF